MKGEPLTNPPQWFGATEIEQGSGAIFPVELMVEMYKYTMDKNIFALLKRQLDLSATAMWTMWSTLVD